MKHIELKLNYDQASHLLNLAVLDYKDCLESYGDDSEEVEFVKELRDKLREACDSNQNLNCLSKQAVNVVPLKDLNNLTLEDLEEYVKRKFPIARQELRDRCKGQENKYSKLVLMLDHYIAS